MTRLRYATIVGIAAGLALSAELYGAQRFAVALLVLIVLMLTAEIEVLRHQADNKEDRP